MRISKSLWASLGGLRNSNLWRRQAKSGRWLYYKAKS